MTQYDDFLRSDINLAVRRYCFQHRVPQDEVWRDLRMRLMIKTGYSVPTSADNKLEEIQRAGHLEVFHAIAEELAWRG
jgi:hypothetical protein